MIHIIDLNFKNKKNCVAAFVVRSGNSAVLVETGPDSCFDALEAGLRNVGLSVETIDAVCLSHIHFDHAGCAWRFAHAGKPIFLHPKGARHMANPEKLIESARRIYLDQMDILWGDIKPIAEAKLIEVGDTEKITVGDITMIAHHTPGHAKHHIAWQYENALFTGDVGGCRIQNGPVILPTPPPDLDYDDWIASLETLAALKAKTLYLTHFGKFNDPESHFSTLTNQLHYAFQLTGTAARNLPDGNIPDTLLDAFYRAHYAAYAMRPETTDAYASIAPNWMNAQGYIRYWRKKKSASP